MQVNYYDDWSGGAEGEAPVEEESWTEEDEQLLQEHWAELMAENETPPIRIIEDPAMPRGSIGFIVI